MSRDNFTDAQIEAIGQVIVDYWGSKFETFISGNRDAIFLITSDDRKSQIVIKPDGWTIWYPQELVV